MGRDTNKDPFPEPPSKALVDEFEISKRGGPTRAHLNLDVTGYKVRSKWNQQGALVIAREYASKDHCINTNLSVLREYVLKHIPALVKQYKALQLEDANSVVRTNVARATEANIRNNRRKGVRTRLIQQLCRLRT